MFVHKPFKFAVGRLMLKLFEPGVNLAGERKCELIDLSVQVLTVPAIAARLVERHEYLERGLAAIRELFAPRTAAGRADSSHVNFKAMHYWRLLIDVEYIFDAVCMPVLVYGADGRRLAQMLDVLERVQFCDPNRRFLQHPGRDTFNPETMFTLHLRLRYLVKAMAAGRRLRR
jgi:hypothetical protein